MKINIEINNPDDILWLESMGKEKRSETIRNCITIGRLAMENYQVHIDGSKNLEPIISKFREELDKTVSRTLDSVSESVRHINLTREEITRMSSNISEQVSVNTGTMIESLRNQNSVTERIIDPITSRIDKMNEEIEKIFSIKGSSNVKGKFGESLIASHIQTAFPHYEVVDMSSTPHEADYHIQTDFGKVLLEIKTYTSSVNREQIDKLYRDIDRTGIGLSIFLSTTSGIVGKKNIEWEVYGKNKTIILFFPNSSLSQQGIVFSFLFLKALFELGVNKETGNTFYKSEEEIHSLLAMFDDFYSDLCGIQDKQSKLRFDISGTKMSIDKLLDELYKQCFELELEQKRSLEKMYGRIRDKLSIHGKSLEAYQWISSRLEFTNWIETLALKPVLNTQLFRLYDLVVELEDLDICYEKIGSDKSIRLVIVKRDNKAVLSTCIIGKTKIDLVFELPKDFSGTLSINPKYECIKPGEITITLSGATECYEIIRNRLTVQN
jgi:hypothetical protein